MRLLPGARRPPAIGGRAGLREKAQETDNEVGSVSP